MDETERDLDSIRLLSWGRVVADGGVVPWLLLDADGGVVEPVRRFLLDLMARDGSPSSIRSYAYVLLRWWRWLNAIGVAWDRATAAEVRDLVLWLGRASNPRQVPRTVSRSSAGTINVVTGKRHLDDSYQPRTIRHNNAVLRSFYEFCIERGEGPLVNPVRLDGRHGGRRHAHHNPMQPQRAGGRIRYNPKVPRRRPREIPDHLWQKLFGSLRSNRDRAILAIAVSNGARASELLELRLVDLDWGDQLVRVVRNGTRAEQWLPTSSEAFVWIRLYLADLAVTHDVDGPLWWTLRRRNRNGELTRQPLTYDALRAVFRRINTMLGTNWSMHDLRHTAALRMAHDERLSLTDVQRILGHAHLSTTEIYLIEDDTEVIHRVRQHLADREQRPDPPPSTEFVGYEAADLAVLLGQVRS